jgi:hypothetical protein
VRLRLERRSFAAAEPGRVDLGVIVIGSLAAGFVAAVILPFLQSARWMGTSTAAVRLAFGWALWRCCPYGSRAATRWP